MKAQSVTTNPNSPETVRTAIYRTGRSLLQELETLEGSPPTANWVARVMMYTGSVLEETHDSDLRNQILEFMQYSTYPVDIIVLHEFLKLWAICGEAYNRLPTPVPTDD